MEISSVDLIKRLQKVPSIGLVPADVMTRAKVGKKKAVDILIPMRLRNSGAPAQAFGMRNE